MKNYLIAQRYARGLSEAISEPAELEAAARVMQRLRRVFRENPGLLSLFSNPAVSMDRRLTVLHEILDANSAPERLRRLAQLLLRRGRMTYLTDVAQVFCVIADERLGRVRATVTTAAPLDEAQSQRLRTAFASYTGKEVNIEAEVDPEILGGVVARIGSIVIDGSVKARLNRLRSALLTEEHGE